MRLDREPRFDRRTISILIVVLFLFILAVYWIRHRMVEHRRVTRQLKWFPELANADSAQYSLLATLNLIGLTGRLDWSWQAYPKLPPLTVDRRT
jgi:hypothetical protein